jgi:hypothetical protein
MRPDVARDMAKSSRAFVQYVWPAVSAWCGIGRLEMVESSTARGLVRDFDTLAGIDAWQLLDHRGFMRGIASRVQEGDRNWRTFTVRSRRHNGARTEFEKRLEALRDRRSGAIYPALTIHGYVRDFESGPLLGAAVVRTIDLYEYLDMQVEAATARTRSTTNADFYYESWDRLAEFGVQLRIWPDDYKAGAA